MITDKAAEMIFRERIQCMALFNVVTSFRAIAYFSIHCISHICRKATKIWSTSKNLGR